MKFYKFCKELSEIKLAKQLYKLNKLQWQMKVSVKDNLVNLIA